MHSGVRWYLRAFWDIYLNIDKVYGVIEGLEKNKNPMTEWVAVYGCPVNDVGSNRFTSAHLFSNFGVRTMMNMINYYEGCSGMLGEDDCVKYAVKRSQLEMQNGCNDGFAVANKR
jgi:hypothetical protein